MSIIVLSDSHMPHITTSTTTVSVKYVVDILDFYNGYGDATECDGTLLMTNFVLPSIGDKYIQYYFLNYLTGTFWEDVVLSDIFTEKTNARNTAWADTTGWDLDKKMIVTYTFSNTGKKDIVTPNDESSVKFEVNTETGIEQTDLAIHWDTGDQYLASHLYFMEKDPNIYIWDADGAEPVDAGSYASQPDTDAGRGYQRYHRENNDSPSHEVYTTKTILTVTAYSKNNYTYYLSNDLNKINNVDLLSLPYTKRELRLAAKGKLPSYDATDLATLDDTNRWLFFNYTKVESGIDIYKYELFFLYKPDMWTKWYGATMTEYEPIDVYTNLISIFFNTGA